LNPETWSGGRSYFRNLLIAFEQIPDPEVELVVFASTKDDTAASNMSIAQVVRTRLMDRGSIPWVFRKLVSKTLNADSMLHVVVARHAIDVIFSLGGPLVRNSSIGCVGWIPDFQHVHLPNFFTAHERRTRDRNFLQLCRDCDKLIVSSECALADLQTFAPQFAKKAEVVHFVASPGLQAVTPSLAELQQRYAFDGPFFLLPNQFWIHKNHRIVIGALKLLKQHEQRVMVLATGSTRDPRQPTFFDSLLQYARECDVLDRFRVLGAIPFADLAGLMRYAVAFINPSLFEGWSTSVEESKSMGKRILLSDIPVHREQAPELGIYFNPEDAEDLALQMRNALREFDPEVDSRNRENARLALPSRQRHFAYAFQRILLSACER
jgi:glycosyltransferase involved in cell wall biosynthesis